MTKSPSTENVDTLVPKVAYKARAEQSLEDILASHGLDYQNIEDVPPEILRELQRRPVFEDFRSLELPTMVIRDSLKQPILKDLLVTRVGSCNHAAGHYIPRPEGSLDCVLHYCVAGKGWCEIADRQWEITEGNVLLIPSKTPHAYGASPEDPWSIHWIHFTGKAALEYCRLLEVSGEQPVFQLPLDSEIFSCFDEIYEWTSQVHNYDHLVAAGGALGRFLSLVNIKRCSINHRTRIAEDRVRQTTQFMKDNLHRQISLQELAGAAHMSPNHYCTTFKKRNGYSPIEYFQRLKIQEACRLLIQTTLQIRQIASRLGFEDPFHFSRIFKRFVGTSPAHYRKSAGG